MTEMLDVLPLSPVREWAIWRSFISALHVVNSGADEVAWNVGRENADHFASGLRHPSSAGRPVGVEGLDLVADPHGLVEAVGAPHDANADLVGLMVAAISGEPVSMQRVDADKIEAQLGGADTRELEAFPDDIERQLTAGTGAGSGIGDLPLTDEALDCPD